MHLRERWRGREIERGMFKDGERGEIEREI